MAGLHQDREKIAQRIQKLLRVTRQHGATEAEASVAAERVAELLALHNMTFSEMEIRSAEHVKSETLYGDKRSDNLLRVVELIALLTDTIAWSRGGVVGFFGTNIDCHMAQHLTRIVWDALESQASSYFQTRNANSASETAIIHQRSSFQRGMADRLRDRIDFLNKERQINERAGAYGAALVPLKRATIRSAFERMGMRLAPFARAGVEIDYNAYLAGQVAGSAVSLNKSVDEDRAS